MCAALLFVSSVFSAATITLDVQADTNAKTWSVYASVSNDCDGLASFWLDVTGSGGGWRSRARR